MQFNSDRPFEMPDFVLRALDKLGAVQPTKAIDTETLIAGLVFEGITVVKNKTPPEVLGPWLESQVKMGVMPYRHYAHFVANTEPTWKGYEWYCNFEPTDSRHPANRSAA